MPARRALSSQSEVLGSVCRIWLAPGPFVCVPIQSFSKCLSSQPVSLPVTQLPAAREGLPYSTLFKVLFLQFQPSLTGV